MGSPQEALEAVAAGISRVLDELRHSAPEWDNFRRNVAERYAQTNVATASAAAVASVGNAQPLLGKSYTRKGFYLFNDANGGAGDIAYIRFGGPPTVVTGEFSIPLPVGARFSSFQELPGYTGAVWVNWATAGAPPGRVCVTEFI